MLTPNLRSQAFRIVRATAVAVLSLCVFALCLLSRTAHGGGGPEGVLLVVNANSDASKEVANHYAQLRGLHDSNVLHLDYEGPLEKADGELFREQILKPILAAIHSRGLGLQIDTIAYSCDFPWQIDLRRDFDETQKLPAQQRPIASLTGATYLWRLVLAKSPAISQTATNWYVPDARAANLSRCVGLGEVRSHGFRGRYAWSRGGERSENANAGMRYLMSTMLGVATGRGNSVEEIVRCLERAVIADTSPPAGAFYFMRTGAVRSQPRHGCYQAVANSLRALRVDARVEQGDMPSAGAVVCGLMNGTATCDPDSVSIQPGAICEHLTSSGGDLRSTAAQTPLSAWVRAGAAGTCGTVAEPYAIQAKFPLPSLHLHYRRGCSLAEAFYQSVASPYQLLIVGDPLCQPWAERPVVDVDGWPAPGATLTELVVPEVDAPQADPDESVPARDDAGDPRPSKDQPIPSQKVLLELTPEVTSTQGEGVASWELFLDGRLQMRLPSGTPFRVHREGLTPGWHELRCVGSNPDTIESQGRLVCNVHLPVEGESDQPAVALSADRLSYGWDEEIVVRCTSFRGEEVAIYQHSRAVGKSQAAVGEVRIDASKLGRGPVRLHAVSTQSGAMSAPLLLQIR